MSKVYSNSSNDIKKLLETNSYSVVLDTNILLNLYRVSPDYAELCIKCLQEIEEYIVIPNTVHHEFKKHNRALYSDRKKALSIIIRGISDKISEQKNKTHNLYKDLQRRNFPNTDELLNKIDALYNQICDELKEYDETHKEINFLNELWDKDVPSEIVSHIKDNDRILPALSADEIFDICDEGVTRYKKTTPPGFKDAKDKDGVRKYADLIWWKEVIKYANKVRKNIILVTDDVKEDWWNQDENGDFYFHPDLLNEFNENTTVKKPNGSESKVCIYPFTSVDFYKCISDFYHIESIGALELSLKVTEDSYIKSLDENIKDFIERTLQYSNDSYIDIDTMTSYGSEGVDEWNVNVEECINHEITDVYDGEAEYYVEYEVSMTGNSYEYWGRDDETKDSILSPPMKHTVGGKVTVCIHRSVSEDMDFNKDLQYEELELCDSDIKEIDFYDCNSSYEDEYEDEYDESDNCNNAYTECPDCGCKINHENDAGNGFCTKCAENH